MGHTLSAFVQIAEVWEPEGKVLRHRSGSYGRHLDFARTSWRTTFERGEGLPGMVWRTGRPEVWGDLASSRFLRREAARAAGLQAGIAFPLFQGGTLTSIVVFLCGSREETGGAIEVWEPNGRGELAHAEGYYGRLHEFEIASRMVRFDRGRGLPGITWERGTPYVVTDAKASNAFVRAAIARSSDLDHGVGIPLHRGREVTHVLAFLSSKETPLARAFEVWIPDGPGRLRLEQASYGSGVASLERANRASGLAIGEQLPGAVFESGRPLAMGSHAGRGYARYDLAERAGLELGIGIPIHDGQRVRAVTVFLG